MSNPFQKASRSQVYVKNAITGPTGSGKTLSAIRLAAGLVEPGKRIAVIDTENESASLYADLTEKQCRDMKIPGEEIEALMATSRLFDTLPISPPFPAQAFSDGILAAVNTGIYGAVVIDSASHLWKGILAYKDQIDSHGKGNSYTNWKQADQKFDPVIEAVLHSKIHVIFCMRSKMDYAQTEENGKKVVKKMGLAPIMRDGLEYEFSTVLDIGLDHTAVASKDRSGLFPTDRIFKVTEATGVEIREWLKTATPKAEPPKPEPKPEPTEAEKYNETVLKLREKIVKNSGQHDPINIEAAFCNKGAALCEDNKSRAMLEQFTRPELRILWEKFKMLMEQVMAQANGSAVA